jgi:hypothetical protein
MAESREEKVWKAIKTILTTDADLNYVGKVYEGWRETTPTSAFPAIYLEPSAATEEPYAVPSRHRINFDIKIIGEIECVDYDVQIIGDATRKGILDLANDIKSVLWKSPNLNGNCQRFSINSTTYDFRNFPFRHCEITMRIELITTGAPR